MLPRIPLRLALAVLGVAVGCARSEKAPERVVPQPSADPSVALCTALKAPTPLAQRFEKLLPLDVGGYLLVLGGTDARSVERSIAPLGLAHSKLVGCGADDVIMWTPGVDERGAEAVRKALLAEAATTQVKESELLPPQSAPPQHGPRN